MTKKTRHLEGYPKAAAVGSKYAIGGEEYEVFEACDSNKGSWVCVDPCAEFIFPSTQIQKDIHIHDDPGKHTLAWNCHECERLEVP